MGNRRGLGLWDFDGTLYRGDSFLGFLRFTFAATPRYWRYLHFIPTFAAWKLGLLSAGSAKERLFGLFFKGWTHQRFMEEAGRFQEKVHPARLDPKAVAEVHRLRNLGYRQVIVSATMEELLGITARQLGMELIGTRVEVVGGRLTGRFATPNCAGAEKVVRLRALLDPAAFSEVVAFGDSPGDQEMLALADRPGYRVFGR